MPRGYYIEDYVYEMTKFIIEHLPVEVALFDRGFSTWGVIYRLKKLKVYFLIFWKKQGDWYQKHFRKLKDGGAIRINREENYKRFKSYFIKNMTGFLLLIST